MTKGVQLGLSESPYTSQGLFSDHYLEVLRGRLDWQSLNEKAEPARQAVKAIVEAYVPSQNEAQTEENLIKPILRALGHSYEVQASLKTPEGTKTPDYVCYRSEAELNANKGQILTDALPQQGAYAVGDAKYWDRSLDHTLKGKSTGDALSNRNPAYQIYFYMLHSGVEWGILTNGRLWRLYHRTSAHKLDRFYEVNLPALLATDDPLEWLYFWAFFSRSAFDAHPLSAASILQASTDYASGISDNLKTQVYQALRHLGQGFLDYAPNDLSPEPATLKKIYDASLILLYRLLFILYAEDRELLPVWESDDYRESYSLRGIKQSVARSLDRGLKLLPTSAKLWPNLKELFGLINVGSPPLKVSTFNGGLFDPKKHPFLERYTVGDAHLQKAIDMLARVGGEFIDYRDLSERHLGNIYEGLLEYHLVPIEPEAANEKAWEGEWRLALMNDRGERHATGSYYTPDYIVKYIVDRTLGPVLREKTAGLEDETEIAEAVLSLNVLDPAMGSGHFLVECVEYIARYLVEKGVHLPSDLATEDEPELGAWKRRVVHSCIYGTDLNPLAVELAKVSLWLSTVAKDKPLSFLDHHLRCGNSLVGSWISELGVANRSHDAKSKKSKGKKQKQSAPLGDHTGLVQLSMLDNEAFSKALSMAVDMMWAIEETSGETVAEVKQQEELYAQLRENLHRRYGRLANVMSARRLGLLQLELTVTEWPLFVDYVSGRSLPAMPQFQIWLETAEQLDEQYRFFHWELEFPEVFFGRNGLAKEEQGGFDAVVGNPPYVRQEALGTFKPYFASVFSETYHGSADLYTYFYQQGLHLLRDQGRLSYIVTNKWMRAGYGEPLRAFFASQNALEEIIDFGHAPIFEDADVFPCILVLHKLSPTNFRQPLMKTVQVTAFPREKLQKVELAQYVREHSHTLPHEHFGRTIWSLNTSALEDLMQKIRALGTPLSTYAKARPFVGIKTGFNKAFLISTAIKEDLVRAHPELSAHIKPYLRGRDIRRWVTEWEELWIILLKSSSDYQWPWANLDSEKAEILFQQTYPALFRYMSQWESELKQRSDKGRFWWELRSCAYYEKFEHPSIFYQDLAYHSRFGVATQGTLAEMTCFFLPVDDKWLLAVLNSPIMWCYMWRNVVHGKDEVLRLKTLYIEALPIARPTNQCQVEAEQIVNRLTIITRAQQSTRKDMLEWLRIEFEVETPGQLLENFIALNEAAFLNEVRKRRPKSAGRLTPTSLRALRTAYAEHALPGQEFTREAALLEARLSTLVNQAYQLTPEEIELLQSTAPPRTPTFLG